MIKRFARWVLHKDQAQQLEENLRLKRRNKVLQEERDEMRPFNAGHLRLRAKQLLRAGLLVNEAKVIMAATEVANDPRGFGVVHPADRWGVPRGLFER